MATSKKAANAPVARRTLTTPEVLPGDGEGTTEVEASSEMVTVAIPKQFNLTQDDGTTVVYKVGVADMPRDHAEHWYAVAHGVTIHADQ
jgi:hypothetical protein